MPTPSLLCRSRWPGRPEHRVEVPESLDLFAALRQAGVPIASSCTGASVCGRCAVEVLEGAEELSEPEEEELRVLRRDDRDPSRERLACRARLSGSQAVITTRYW